MTVWIKKNQGVWINCLWIPLESTQNFESTSSFGSRLYTEKKPSWISPLDCQPNTIAFMREKIKNLIVMRMIPRKNIWPLKQLNLPHWAIPLISNGKYLLAENVVTCPQDVFKRIVKSVIPNPLLTSRKKFTASLSHPSTGTYLLYSICQLLQSAWPLPNVQVHTHTSK